MVRPSETPNLKIPVSLANAPQAVREFIEKEAIPIMEDAWRQNRRGSRANLQDIVNRDI